MVGKVLEKIIRKQADNFLWTRNYLKERQHGFKERWSYVTNQARIRGEIPSSDRRLSVGGNKGN